MFFLVPMPLEKEQSDSEPDKTVGGRTGKPLSCLSASHPRQNAQLLKKKKEMRVCSN